MGGTTRSHLRRPGFAAWLPWLFAIGSAAAQPIDLNLGSVNMFRDTRGANDIGITPGDRFQFGGNIRGGSAEVSLGATYGPTGFTVSQFLCEPLAVNANFCARTTPFNASRLEPWTLRFTRGTETLEVAGPSLAGTEVAVPFPVSVTLSGSSLTPRISWQVPGGFTPDAFRVNVYDKSRLLGNGSFDQVHSAPIAADATFYDIPSLFSSGIALQAGGNYAINLQMIETRGHAVFSGNNAQILRRSSSFFYFTPLTGNGPPEVALPTVVDGVYNFDIASVGPASTTFIDPLVAVGYDYAIGAGNPNFASVLLPNVGDGQYTLSFNDASGARIVTLAHDTQYFFGNGGVSAFRVTGIETDAGLDPANATAFVTGLTFAANGSFTGTMTPITVFVPGVPEPSAWWLACAGLAALALRWRKPLA